MDKSLVFVSHASQDKHYAELLGDYIERTIENTKVFVASAPESKPSGSDWFREILQNLSGADALVIVYSRNARSSLWLGFELGHFWRKHDGKNLHCVFDPSIKLPSPLNERQAKNLTDVASTAVFFRGLACDLGRRYDADEIGITQIVDAAPKYDEFAKWKSLLQNGQWSKQELSTEQGYKTVWTSQDDMSYQIEDPDVVAVKNFSEPWATGFPDSHAYSYHVNLNVSGSTVKQELFVSLDGGRYSVPMPEQSEIKSRDKSPELHYYYDRNSLKYLLGNVIGSYYPNFATDLVQFAARKGIEIV
ncbi:MAG: toll/interleukin-1 receptor domain-containing protein [Anaerolineae bacterium]|nr:toll/interleukin-1 receptor domain-containing protein [Anaerolineae bacterium]